jgi:hypothetical protein
MTSPKVTEGRDHPMLAPWWPLFHPDRAAAERCPECGTTWGRAARPTVVDFGLDVEP